jgi:hypothetical protein
MIQSSQHEMRVEPATGQVLLLRNESGPPIRSSCTESNRIHLSVLVALKLNFLKQNTKLEEMGVELTTSWLSETLTTRLTIQLCFR